MQLPQDALEGSADATRTPVSGRRRLVVVLLVLVALGGLIWGLARVRAGPRAGGPAPDFTFTTFDGETVTLSALRGKIVVVNFWASWCPPCREEAPYLEQAWRRYRDRDVVFLGLDYLDLDAKGRAFLEEFGLTYPNGPDLGTRIARAYRVQGVPETFFVDRQGISRGVKVGPLFPSEIDERLEALLAPTTP